jgi:hypothetical protein
MELFRSVLCFSSADVVAATSCVTKVSHKLSDRLYLCYKSVTQSVRQAVSVLQKCHMKCQTTV